MPAGAAAQESASAARARADLALAAWHRGAATADSVLPLLHRTARSAVDYSNLGAVFRAAGNQQEAEISYR